VLIKIFEPKRDEVVQTGENCTMRSFIIFALHQIFLGNKIKEENMSVGCSTHGGNKNVIQNFDYKT
jgi:hypothetical protein